MEVTTTPNREEVVVKYWDGQKKFYSEKSKQNKLRHNSTQIIIIVCGALTPILVSIESVSKIFPLITSLIVTVAAGLDNFMDYGQTWLSYRQANESLRLEKMLFDSRSGRYKKTDDAVNLFALRCQKICGSEVPDFIKRKSSNNSAEGIEQRSPSNSNAQDI